MKRKDAWVGTSGCIKISGWITVWHGIAVSKWSDTDVLEGMFILIFIYH